MGKKGKEGVDKKDAFLPPSLPSSVSDKIAFLLRSSSRANIFLPVRITLSEEDRGRGGGTQRYGIIKVSSPPHATLKQFLGHRQIAYIVRFCHFLAVLSLSCQRLRRQTGRTC